MKDRAVTFYIHAGNYVYASFYASDGRLRTSTGITGESIEALPKAKKNTLSRIETAIDKHIGDCNLAERPVLKSNIEAIILSVTGRREKGSGLTVSGLIQKFISEAKNGAVLTKKGDVYSPNTIRFAGCLLRKLENDKIAFRAIQDLTPKDIEALSVRLMNTDRYGNKDKGKSAKNGTASYVNQLVAILSTSHRLGWHNNNICREANLTHPVEAIDYPIYYSVDELMALSKHEFESQAHRELRDVFIFGCFTCLRHSDYYQTDYRNAIKGNELTVKLQKRKNQITIPLHPTAAELLKKYDYALPRFKMVRFNVEIRKVCKLAGFTDKVLFTRTHGGVLQREYKEKWELTTSHTMRRTYATNAMKGGMEQWAVMNVGGWKSEASFRKYLRMSEQDVKDNAMASAFYKGG